MKKRHPIYKNLLLTDSGEFFSGKTGKRLGTRLNQFGYVTVKVPTGKGKTKTRKAHRLVAETYLGIPDTKLEVNHIDCDKTNNHVSNLEWVTSKQNKEHAWANGLYTSKGENHYNSVLSEENVHNICKSIQDGERNIDIARKYNIGRHLISHIKRGDLWKDIVSQYNLIVPRNLRKSEGTVRSICEMLSLGKTDREISEALNVKRPEVGRIRRREVHTRISKEYEF